MAQNTIKGTVLESDGTPVIGANVLIKNTDFGTITDVDGSFEINNLSDGRYTLLTSYIGYDTVEKTIDVPEITNINFVMSDGVTLEGLIVTAQKREQSIMDIPTALTSISENFIKETGSSEIDQLASYIPGLQVQVQSPNTPGFVIRGITSDDGASNVEPRVSVFQDGVSISKARGSVVEIFDMERIEVLKGPQGTLFGRGAQIGALHLIQKKPTNNLDAGAAIGYGNYNYKYAEFFANAPIVENKFMARISGMYKGRDGFIDNLSGGNLNGKDTKATRGSFKWLPTDQTNLTLIANYQNDTPPGTAFKSGTYAPKGGDVSPYTFADLEDGKELGVDRDVWGLTLLGKHYFSDHLSLSSITAYRNFDSDELFDADGTVAPVLSFKDVSKGKQFSQELRLNFEVGNNFEGFVGGNYFMENGSQKVPFITDERSYLALVSPLAAGALNAQLQPLNDLYQLINPGYTVAVNPVPLVNNGVAVLPATIGDLLSSPLIPYTSLPLALMTPEQIAGVQQLYGLISLPLAPEHEEYYKNYGDNSAFELFADGTYKITEQLKVTGGIRLSMESIKSSYEAGGDTNANLGLIRNAGTNLLFMPTDKISKKENFTSWVGRLALNYSINEDWEAYGSISKGRRPNVIQFVSTPKNDGTFTSTYAPQTLNDEVVNSYEIGIKGLAMAKSLYFDIAGFYYGYQDFQTTAIDPNTFLFITKDAGDATAYGTEASLKYQVTDMLSLFGNYAYVNAEFSDEDSDGNKQELAGNTFRLTPKHSFALGANASFDLTEKVKLFVRPSYKYKSKIYFEETNLDAESQKAYGLLDGRIGLELPENKLTLTFFMNNILNKEYLIDAGNTGRNFGIPTYIAGQPRMYGVELKYGF